MQATHQDNGHIHVFFLLATSLLTACSTVDENPGGDELGEYDGIRLTCLNEDELNYWYQKHLPTTPNYGSIYVCVNETNLNGGATGEFDYIEDYEATDGDPYPSWDSEIRTLCSTACVDRNQVDGMTPVCEDENWTGHEFTEFNGMSWNPSLGLNCYIALGGWLVTDPDASTIDWNEGVGSPLSIPLECSLDSDCVDEFDADIDEWALAFEIGGMLDPIDPYTRAADYDCASGLGGATLELDMNSGSGAGHDDEHPLYGQAEYSAPDCGESTCPFYLAAFNASNTAHEWDIWLDVPPIVDEPKTISDVFIESLQSGLVVWRPSTGQVAFPVDSLALEVRFTVSSDCTGCSGIGDGEHTFRFTNSEVMFGSIDPSDGSLELGFTFSVPGGEGTISMDLAVDGHPPSALIDIGAPPRCTVAGGYQLSVSDSSSTDPDNDIESMYWIVDGIPRTNGYVISVGEHTIDLVIMDDRGAVSVAGEQSVEVITGPACL